MIAADAYNMGNTAPPVISMKAYVVPNRHSRDSNPMTNEVFPNNRRFANAYAGTFEIAGVV